MVAAMVTSRICESKHCYTNDAVDDIDDHAGDAGDAGGDAGDHAGDHAGQALPVDQAARICRGMRLHAIPLRRETPRHQDTRSITTFMLLLCLSGVIAKGAVASWSPVY